MPASDPSSEFGLIDWIRQRTRAVRSPLTKLGIGDDCAILDVGSRHDLLVTTDMLLDGRHFRLEEHSPEQVGYKALAVNLSDIAAMAAVPRAALVAIALPQIGAAELAKGIFAGLAPLADRFQVDLIGGDTNAWNGPLVISVTLIGEATPGARSAAVAQNPAIRSSSPVHSAAACTRAGTSTRSPELPRPSRFTSEHHCTP